MLAPKPSRSSSPSGPNVVATGAKTPCGYFRPSIPFLLRLSRVVAWRYLSRRASIVNRHPSKGSETLRLPCLETSEREVIQAVVGHWHHTEGHSMTVTLQPLTRENLWPVVALKVHPEQENFVAPNIDSIANAYVEPSFVPLAVYAGEDLVGFAMYGQHPDTG